MAQYGKLDWSRFDARGIGHEKAFEAFTAQIFERWLYREHPSLIKSYILNGSGGDGGVEAFGCLENGNVVGLQAKWFPGSIDDARIRQVKKSITTAKRNYPGLNQYVIAIPSNLTKGSGNKKGGVERWDGLIREVSKSYPDLQIIRWDESALFDQLSTNGNLELKALWFEGEFTMERVRSAWERTRARLDQRYIPDLHAVGRLEEVLEQDLWESDWVIRASKLAKNTQLSLSECRSKIVDFLGISKDLLSVSLEKKFNELRLVLDDLVCRIDEIQTTLGYGPRRIAQVPDSHSRLLRELDDELSAFKEAEHHLADFALKSVREIRSLLEAIKGLELAIRASTTPRLMIGPSGCGKTHATAEVVKRLVENEKPAILILAKEGSPAQGFIGFLLRSLDLSSEWSLAQILDGFEALAIIRQISEAKEKTDVYVRSLIAIDGLEESSDWNKWTDVLNELKVELDNRPRIHLIATARPETLQRMVRPRNFSYSLLDEDGGVVLTNLLQAYAKQYKINIDAVPWLGLVLRSPLEIRLFAEEFSCRSISLEQGSTANLLTLFRSKLRRIETEARQKAGTLSWSDGLDLVTYVLIEVAKLVSVAGIQYTSDRELINALSKIEQEFTAERIRFVLRLLVEYGLIDTFKDHSSSLLPSVIQYGLATRHVSDFICAQTAFQDIKNVLSPPTSPVQYPEGLIYRHTSSVIFAAMLAEAGHFIVDIQWRDAPEDIVSIHVESLALVSPDLAVLRRAEIESLLKTGTSINRKILEKLICPVSRIPCHPLGPALLDGALRAMPMFKRDQIWSVPDDLSGEGPWVGNYSRVLDDLQLSLTDGWDGMPLISAWTCSSVVEERRQKARENLAVWGSVRLDQMVLLLEHMVSVDDSQLVADIVIAAFGAAVGADISNKALLKLAYLVDELFFAENAKYWTSGVNVRIAARGIIERGALIFPKDIDDSFLLRCRPPYKYRGQEWPTIDLTEVKENGHFGGRVVTEDLNWYVAKRCLDPFSGLSYLSEEEGQPEIDYSLVEAIENGSLLAPAQALKKIKKDRLKKERRQIGLFTVLQKLQVSLSPEDQRLELEKKYSNELRELIEHYRRDTGISDISLEGIRNGMVANLVRSWGWSEEEFCYGRYDDSVRTVDHAIVRQHGSGSTHGSRSAVCRFREKYIWSAVDVLTGQMTDRLPVWSNKDRNWIRLNTLDGLGNGFPDPLPQLGYAEEEVDESRLVWTPSNINPVLFSEELDPVKRAERWLTESHFSDVKSLLWGPAEEWKRSVILSLSHYRKAHQSCIDQFVQVRAFGVRTGDVALLKRDAAFLKTHFYEVSSGIEDGVYISAALACWSPWFKWGNLDVGYNSFDEQGNVKSIPIFPMVGSFSTRFEGAWPQEPTVWIPSPHLGRELNIIKMEGGRYARSFYDRQKNRIAVERDLPEQSFDFEHHYLAMDLDLYIKTLAARGLTPIWGVRLLREATPALFMRKSTFSVPKGLKHRSHDQTWLVIGTPNECEIISASDLYERWKSKKK